MGRPRARHSPDTGGTLDTWLVKGARSFLLGPFLAEANTATVLVAILWQS